MKAKTYCLVCKKLTDNTDSNTVKNKGRLMMKSICPKIKKYIFVLEDLVHWIV